MKTISLVIIGVVVWAVVGCGGSSSQATRLVRGNKDAALASKREKVGLLGVDAEGTLLYHGEFDASSLTVSDGRVTKLPEGKPTDIGELMIKSHLLFVVIIDAGRPAKDVHAAIRSLDKFCWGFGVTVGKKQKLGIALPKPCPAGAPAPSSERPELSLVVTAEKVKFSVSRVNEATTVARGDEVGEKLVEYKKSPFFAGECADAADEPSDDDEEKPDDGQEESGGTGTAMALEEGKLGGGGSCDVLLAFDDGATVGDVIEFYRLAMDAGFTTPHWVKKSQLPSTKSEDEDEDEEPEAKPKAKAKGKAKGKAKDKAKDDD